MTADLFFRFPHTPHLAWLGEGSAREDKVFSPAERTAFLEKPVSIEEKVDGANIGISLSPAGEIRVQNRGQYIQLPSPGQFGRLPSWLAVNSANLIEALGQNLILFGEWCTARHTVAYEELPDWFLAFDVYDREEEVFWSTRRRNELAALIGVPVVPSLFEGRASFEQIKALVMNESSRLGGRKLEGVVIRQQSQERLLDRAKLVHPEFTQSITEHWKNRRIEWNKLGAPIPANTSCCNPPSK
jgi:ATP-dependent RNA circularization protein (DNA/RNA ligase family)